MTSLPSSFGHYCDRFVDFVVVVVVVVVIVVVVVVCECSFRVHFAFRVRRLYGGVVCTAGVQRAVDDLLWSGCKLRHVTLLLLHVACVVEANSAAAVCLLVVPRQLGRTMARGAGLPVCSVELSRSRASMLRSFTWTCGAPPRCSYRVLCSCKSGCWSVAFLRTMGEE